MIVGCRPKPDDEKVDAQGNRILLLDTVGHRIEAKVHHSVTNGVESVTLIRGEKRIEIQPESTAIRINGIPVVIDQPVQWIGGYPYMCQSDVEQVIVPLLRPDCLPSRRPVTRILIDPGHGGKDSGAANPAANLREKDLTLETSRRLARILSQMGYTVALTRNEDRFIELAERPAAAADFGADLFLSIHFNAAENPDARGVEVFALTPASADPTQAPLPGHSHTAWNNLLAYSIQSAIILRTGQPDRGVKRARFAVLRQLTCPGVLIEGGFVSNSDDAALLQTEAYLQSLAQAIADGVKAYNSPH